MTAIAHVLIQAFLDYPNSVETVNITRMSGDPKNLNNIHFISLPLQDSTHAYHICR